MPSRDATPSALVMITCAGAMQQGDLLEFDRWEVRSSRLTTVLIGEDVDQAALHGALDRLQRLGVHVVEVTRRPTGSRP